jgi:hypothetical protein
MLLSESFVKRTARETYQYVKSTENEGRSERFQGILLTDAIQSLGTTSG